MSFEETVFKDKKLADIFEEIYINSKQKKNQINDLIAQLSEQVESPADAIMIVPLIKDYLEVGVKNNEHLIKLAGVVQRMKKATEGEDVIDFGEIQDLLEASKEELQESTPATES